MQAINNQNQLPDPSAQASNQAADPATQANNQIVDPAAQATNQAADPAGQATNQAADPATVTGFYTGILDSSLNEDELNQLFNLDLLDCERATALLSSVDVTGVIQAESGQMTSTTQSTAMTQATSTASAQPTVV